MPDATSDLAARLSRAVAPAYEIEGELGRGGMGIVYGARDVRLGRRVAIKLLPPDLAFRDDIRARFLREAQMAARLAHPNIVPIHAVDERDGLVFFVMGLVEGESLGERLRRLEGEGRRLPVAEARRILREVADALAYAHARGVVHRDVKPDNILLDARGEGGRAHVTDFGIARAATEGESRLTATGAAIGTPAYMSPEQCAADRELDGRSDLYSLGAVAYHMLAGAPPFAGSSTPAIMVKQVTERPVPVGERRPDVPADLAAIVMRLLEKDPADRFADGAALVAALDGEMPDAGTAPTAPAALAAPERASSASLFVGLRATRDGVRFGAGELSRPARPPGEVDTAHAQIDVARTRIREKMRMRGEVERLKREVEEARPLPDRIRRFRRHVASYAGTTIFLFGINAMTGGSSHHVWWAIFPALVMLTSLLSEGGGLWAAGARMRDVFGGAPERAAALPPAGTPPAATPDTRERSLMGPRGAVLWQAEVDRRAIHDHAGRLSDAERAALPDVVGAADGLYDRVVALASALQRLDGEIAPDRLPTLEARIAEMERSDTAGGDGERRLSLLRRQRDALADLVRSRDALAEQYESAGLLLQNLSLDLLKVRSSGLGAALDGVTSVTQEARALSREIGYVLDAADELRTIE